MENTINVIANSGNSYTMFPISLGEGSFGQVFECKDSNGQRHAAKIILRSQSKL